MAQRTSGSFVISYSSFDEEDHNTPPQVGFVFVQRGEEYKEMPSEEVKEKRKFYDVDIEKMTNGIILNTLYEHGFGTAFDKMFETPAVLGVNIIYAATRTHHSLKLSITAICAKLVELAGQTQRNTKLYFYTVACFMKASKKRNFRATDELLSIFRSVYIHQGFYITYSNAPRDMFADKIFFEMLAGSSYRDKHILPHDTPVSKQIGAKDKEASVFGGLRRRLSRTHRSTESVAGSRSLSNK